MKLDPIELWNNLGKKGKIAFAVGAIALAGYYLYRKHQAAVAAAAAPTDSQTSTSTSGTADSGTSSDTTVADQTAYDQGMTDAEASLGGSYQDPYGGYGATSGGIGGYGAQYPGSDANPAVNTSTDDLTAFEEGAAFGNGLNNTPAIASNTTASVTGGGAPKGKVAHKHQVTKKPSKPAAKAATTSHKTTPAHRTPTTHPTATHRPTHRPAKRR